MLDLDLNTKLHMPYWWVNSYELTASVLNRFSSSADLVETSKLNPALSLIELEALAGLISTCQKWMLKEVSPIEIDPESHSRLGPYTNLNQRFAFDRLIQMSASIGLLSEKDGKTHEVYPLFKQCQWTRLPSREGLGLTLMPSELGFELMFGVVDPYMDLLRFKNKKTCSRKLVGSQRHLSLWYSLWLDLRAIEKILLVRLEKAVQWERLFLSLDGVFGVDLDSLFSELDLPGARRKNNSTPPLLLKKRIFEKLGRKLKDHGFISRKCRDDYVPLKDPGAFTLLWQMSEQYFTEESTKAYIETIGERLHHLVTRPNIISILKLLLGQTHQSYLQKALNIWEKIDAVKLSDRFCELDGSGILDLKLLFIEWHIRQLPEHQYPLSLDVSYSEIADITGFLEDVDLELAINKFVELFWQSESLSQEVSEKASYTMTSVKSRLSGKLFPVLSSLNKIDAIPASESKPKIPTHNSELTSQKPVVKSRVIPQKSKNINELRKLALVEIERLRLNEQKAYSKLKESYIDTLDSEKRKIILEVKQRLKPEVFDNHLQSSLVRYLIDNPDAWDQRNSNS